MLTHSRVCWIQSISISKSSQKFLTQCLQCFVTLIFEFYWQMKYIYFGKVNNITLISEQISRKFVWPYMQLYNATLILLITKRSAGIFRKSLKVPCFSQILIERRSIVLFLLLLSVPPCPQALFVSYHFGISMQTL